MNGAHSFILYRGSGQKRGLAADLRGSVRRDGAAMIVYRSTSPNSLLLFRYYRARKLRYRYEISVFHRGLVEA